VQLRFSLSSVLKAAQFCHKILSQRCRNHHPEQYFDEVHLELQEQVTAWHKHAVMGVGRRITRQMAAK
jgi:hypothetical protein